METPRQRLLSRLQELRRERATWEPHWRELADNILPRRARWNRGDANRGDKVNGSIINNTPMIAARILSSGMMAGLTSPSRVWFRLTTSDPELADFAPVRAHLHLREERLRWALARSNFYNALADAIYPDIGVFGTACGIMEEDVRRALRVHTPPLGEYFLAANENDEIDTIFRDIPMTARQIVRRFGLKACSSGVRNAWDRGNYGTTFSVVHAIYPNDELVPGRLDRHGMMWASKWFEKESNERDGLFLSEGGYHEFPGLCPRWATKSGDIYGRSPGMEVLGDSKALQHLERRLAMLLDKVANPPMKASEALRAGRASLLPGDATYLPNGQGHIFEPSIDMAALPPAIREVLLHIQRHEDRIDKGMMADLWLAILNDDRKQRATATEVEQGKQETMLQLGPVLENLNGSLLEPGLVRADALLDRRGWMPEPPRELQGQELKVEFISIMHQAQKMTGLAGVRTLVQEVGLIAQLGRTDVLDKLNVDEIVDQIAEMTGVKPDMILSSDQVKQIRASRAARQQAMDQGAALQAAAAGAKDVSAVDPEKLAAVGQVVAPVAAAAGGFPQGAATA